MLLSQSSNAERFGSSPYNCLINPLKISLNVTLPALAAILNGSKPLLCQRHGTVVWTEQTSMSRRQCSQQPFHEDYQRMWKQHVLRMPLYRFPRQALFYRPNKWDLGRPQKVGMISFISSEQVIMVHTLLGRRSHEDVSGSRGVSSTRS